MVDIMLTSITYTLLDAIVDTVR